MRGIYPHAPTRLLHRSDDEAHGLVRGPVCGGEQFHRNDLYALAPLRFQRSAARRNTWHMQGYENQPQDAAWQETGQTAAAPSAPARPAARARPDLVAIRVCRRRGGGTFRTSRLQHAPNRSSALVCGMRLAASGPRLRDGKCSGFPVLCASSGLDHPLERRGRSQPGQTREAAHV